MKTLPGLAVPVLSAAEASMADDDIVRLLQDDKFYVGRYVGYLLGLALMCLCMRMDTH
jgi:hypothetical protein